MPPDLPPAAVTPRRGLFNTVRLWWSRSCLLLLGVLTFLVVDSLWIHWLQTSAFVVVYGGSIVLLSLVTMIVYWIDKRRAVQGSYRRIPESTLHVLGLMGGWPGASIAQEFLRHKTQKTSFRVMFWVTVLLHGLGLTWGLWEVSQRFSAKQSTSIPQVINRNELTSRPSTLPNRYSLNSSNRLQESLHDVV